MQKLFAMALAWLASSMVAHAADMDVFVHDDFAVFSIAGAIDDDDAERLLSGVQQLQSRLAGRVVYVSFNSDGGNLKEAMKLGRLIRKLGFSTSVADEGRCLSACVFAFAGGSQRWAEDKMLGVHRFWISSEKLSGSDPTALIEEVQAMNGQVYSYVTEMGVKPELISLMLNTPSKEMRYLTVEEATELNLAEWPDS